MRELALNARNYEALVAFTPGVAIEANPSDELDIGNSSFSGASAQIPYSVNGSRNAANNWMVDGADNVGRGANLTLMKNFNLYKEGRVTLQLRGEAFNVLNWVNPGAFASTNITSTSFGEIAAYRAPRRIQLSAKIAF